MGRVVIKDYYHITSMNENVNGLKSLLTLTLFIHGMKRPLLGLQSIIDMLMSNEDMTCQQDSRWSTLQNFKHVLIMCLILVKILVFPSPTSYMLTSFEFLFVNLRYVLKIPLKWWIIFLKSWFWTSLFLKFNRFSPFIDHHHVFHCIVDSKY